MMGIGFGIFGLLFMLFFRGGLIALAVWLVSGLFPPNSSRPMLPAYRNLSACQILDRPYAWGKLTREQYELLKQDVA